MASQDASPTRREKSRRKRIALADILAAIAGPAEELDDNPKKAQIDLTKDEHQRLKILAAESDTSVQAIGRAAILAFIGRSKNSGEPS